MVDLILSDKMESLRRCIQRIEEKTPDKVDRLIADPNILSVSAN